MRLCLPHSRSLSFCLSLSLSVSLYHISSLWLCGSCLSSAVHETKKNVKWVREIKLTLPCLFLKLQKCFVRNVHSSSNAEVTEGSFRGHFNHNHMSFLLCLFSFYCSPPCWKNCCKIAIKQGILFYPHVVCSVVQLGIAHKQTVILTASYNHQHCILMSKMIERDFQKEILLLWSCTIYSMTLLSKKRQA